MAESQCIAQARRLDGGSVALTGRHAIACDESMCGIADRHRAGRCGAGRRGMGSGVGVARRCAGRGRRTFEKCRAFENATRLNGRISELRATNEQPGCKAVSVLTLGKNATHAWGGERGYKRHARQTQQQRWGGKVSSPSKFPDTESSTYQQQQLSRMEHL